MIDMTKWMGVAFGAATMAFSVAPAAAQSKLPALPKAPAGVTEGIAAVVNDEVVSTVDVRNRAVFILASAGAPITTEAIERARPQAMRTLVDEHLQIQEAKKSEVTVPDADVEAALANIAERNGGSVADLTNELAQAGIPISTLRAQIKADIAWRRLVNGRLGGQVRVTDAQVADTMSRIVASSTKPQMLVSEIVLPAETEQERSEARAGALQLLEQLRQTPPDQHEQMFALAARQYSASSSASTGGDLGWVSAGEVRKELESVLDGMQPGQMSEPVETETGVHLLELRERRPGLDRRRTTRFTLQQITAPASASSGLERARRRIAGCENVRRAAGSVNGAKVVDLGDVAQADLSDTMAEAVDTLSAGQTSNVLINGDSASLLVVCARAAEGEGIPTRDEVENRLFDQELAMLSQRYLRNLRRDSTIITP